MNYGMIMAAGSALVLGHSLFLALYFWQLPNKKKLANRLLALLLLALAIRIIKSVVVVLFPEAPAIWPAIGVLGLSAIGPLLWLYLRSALDVEFVWTSRQLVHFIPTLLVALSFPLITEKGLYFYYVFLVFYMFVYWLISARSVWTRRDLLSEEPLIRRWTVGLLGGIFFIWLAFFFQLRLETFMSYVSVTTSAALVLYGLSFWAMRHSGLFRRLPLEKTNTEDQKEFEDLAQRILHAFDEERAFTDPNLTLPRLADQLNVQAYLLSRAVNTNFGKSFPEFLYTRRVKAAEDMLAKPKFQHLSIEAIAYDCGFNSLSSFYTAFKKINGVTPAEYRKKVI